MAFNIDASSLLSASARLDVIGNNISNANTIGFKGSDFDSVLASLSSNDAGTKKPGSRQLFTDGSIVKSTQPLNMAIDGQGFFRVVSNGATVYTRDGQFSADRYGKIVNSAGDNLTGYTANALGNLEAGKVVSLSMSLDPLPATATTDATIDLVLDTRNEVIDQSAMPFNPKDPTTYTDSTTTAVYDGQGQAHDVRTFYVKTAVDQWKAYATVDGQFVDTSKSSLGNLSFGSDGILLPGNSFSYEAGPDQYINVEASRDMAKSAWDVRSASTATSTVFDPADPATYSQLDQREVYDASGQAHTVNSYYVNSIDANQKSMVSVYLTVDGSKLGTNGKIGDFNLNTATGALEFTSNGVLTAVDKPLFYVPIGVKNITFDVNSTSSLTDLRQILDGGGTTFVDSTVNPFDPAATASYTKTFSHTFTDDSALKATHTVDTYYVRKSATESDVYVAIDGELVGLDGKVGTYVGNGWDTTTSKFATFAFTSNGTFENGQNGSFTVPVGGATQSVALDLNKAVQYASSFVATGDQNGGAGADLESYGVDAQGLITARYSDGRSKLMGQVVLATFTNPDGLAQVGSNQWRPTSSSGGAQDATPGLLRTGLIQGSSKEQANVDISAEMITMITAQRTFQAAAEMIKKQDEIMQTVVGLARG
ncbi:MAG: hypothetical protein RLZZ22_1733 [Pseudomonadota bacterium]|jgi:flagellar hook protein FlgE